MFIIINNRTATPETSNGHSLRIFSDRHNAAQYMTDRNLDADRYDIYEIAPEPEKAPERETSVKTEGANAGLVEEYLHFDLGETIRAYAESIRAIQTLETRRVYYVKELMTSRRYDAEFDNPADAGHLAHSLSKTQDAYVWAIDVETRYIVRGA